MSDRADRLGVAETWDQATIHDREDGALRLHRGVGRLIQDASHLPVAFRTAVTVVDARTLFVAGTGAPFAERRERLTVGKESLLKGSEHPVLEDLLIRPDACRAFSVRSLVLTSVTMPTPGSSLTALNSAR